VEAFGYVPRAAAARSGSSLGGGHHTDSSSSSSSKVHADVVTDAVLCCCSSPESHYHTHMPSLIVAAAVFVWTTCFQDALLGMKYCAWCSCAYTSCGHWLLRPGTRWAASTWPAMRTAPWAALMRLVAAEEEKRGVGGGVQGTWGRSVEVQGEGGFIGRGMVVEHDSNRSCVQAKTSVQGGLSRRETHQLGSRRAVRRLQQLSLGGWALYAAEGH
jgi:hypothetical protein